MADSSEDERRRTETLSFSEAASIDVSQIAKVAAVSVDPRGLGLSLVYFGAVATNYGLSFFLPQMVRLHPLSRHAGFCRAVCGRSDRDGLVGPALRPAG